MFKVGDVVVKSGMGICRIKALQSLTVEGTEKNLYVLQAGEVKVMIPCDKAHAGALRPILTPEKIEELESFLRAAFPLPGEYEKEDPEQYSVDPGAAFDTVKHREPQGTCDIIHKLFYKSKLVKLTDTEEKIYKEAMKVLCEEIAHVQHTTRQKVNAQLKKVLTEGRQSRKDWKPQPST